MMTNATLRCPVDGNEMQIVEHGESNYHACMQCRGLWLRRTFLLALRRKAASHLKHHAFHTIDPVSHSNQLNCPVCSLPLEPCPLDGIPTDVCPSCKALWLDGDELLHLGKATLIAENRTNASKKLQNARRDAAFRALSRNQRCEIVEFTGAIMATGVIEMLAEKSGALSDDLR